MIDPRTLAWRVLVPEPTRYEPVGCPTGIASALATAQPPGTRTTLVAGAELCRDISLRDYDAVVWLDRSPSGAELRRMEHDHIHQFAVLPSLHDARWYIPLTSRRHMAAGLDLITPFRTRTRIMKRALRLSARMGFPGLFRDRVTIATREPSPLDTFLAETFGQRVGAVALAPGRAGDDRKLTALALDRAGQKLAFIKVGTTPDARDVLDNERAWLDRLSQTELANSVPAPLGWAEYAGQTLLAVSPGPEKQGPVTLTHLHRCWLARLQLLDTHHAPFAKSATAARIASTWPAIRTRVTPAWRGRIERAIRSVTTALSDRSMALSPAHGDFAPWNTRLTGSGSLYVFDWELARAKCIPLYDVMHFQFMSRVLLEHRLAPCDVSSWLREQVGARGPSAAPDVPVTVLFGAFLVDLAIHYLELMANRGLQTDDLVLEAIAPLLDGMSLWWTEGR